MCLLRQMQSLLRSGSVMLRVRSPIFSFFFSFRELPRPFFLFSSSLLLLYIHAHTFIQLTHTHTPSFLHGDNPTLFIHSSHSPNNQPSPLLLGQLHTPHGNSSAHKESDYILRPHRTRRAPAPSSRRDIHSGCNPETDTPVISKTLFQL